MKTQSKFTVAFSVLLFGIGWLGIRTAQALQKPDAPATTTDANEGSGSAVAVPAAATATPEEIAAAEELLQKARAAILNDRTSMQADLTQTLFASEDRKHIAQGTYVAGKFPRLKLTYTIRVGQMQGILEEVCDGQILHSRKRIAKVGAEKNSKEVEQEFTRRDVQRILAATENATNLPLAVQVAELGIGGLPAILASIDRSMIGRKVTQEEFDGQMCQVFHGGWDPAVLEKYKKADKQFGTQMEMVLPDQVRVYFASEALVPVKFVYIAPQRDEKGTVVGERTVMTFELKNVVLDKELPGDLFEYVLPNGAEEKDLTQDFIKMMKESSQALEAPVEEKK